MKADILRGRLILNHMKRLLTVFKSQPIRSWRDVLVLGLLMAAPLGACAERVELDASGPAAKTAGSSTAASGYQGAVKAYREGQFLAAEKGFTPLHAQHPDNMKITYYLAITEAQLGRFAEARRLYGEIVLLEPNGQTAALAKEGLSYLPADDAALDQPPRFQAGGVPNAAPVPAASTPNTGLSPQDQMMWQMMMGQNNNNSNPMGWMMPQTGATGDGAALDPGMMSTMMMNQMLQGFNLNGNPDDNR